MRAQHLFEVALLFAVVPWIADAVAIARQRGGRIPLPVKLGFSAIGIGLFITWRLIR
jgi:hypothetical protein